MVLSLARSTIFSSTTCSSSRRNVHRARPAGGVEQAKAISFGLRGTSEHARPGRGWRMLARKNGIEAFFNQLLTGPADRRDTGVQGPGDPAIAPSLAALRDVSLQQDASLHQQLCRMFAF